MGFARSRYSGGTQFRSPLAELIWQHLPACISGNKDLDGLTPRAHRPVEWQHTAEWNGTD